MQTKEIKIVVFEYEHISELSEKDQELVLAAREISAQAYAPYSSYKVGAALRLTDGRIVRGNNQENASFPEGLCAERTVLFWANANFPNEPVLAIAVAAVNKNGEPVAFISPCGACRQALLETEHRFKQPIRVILDYGNKFQVLNNVQSLLPLNFNGDSLNV